MAKDRELHEELAELQARIASLHEAMLRGFAAAMRAAKGGDQP